MRLTTLSVGLLAILTPLTAAWSKEDREIFRLRDELAAAEGPEVNFYQYLGIPQSASQDDINKAYRKKSRSFHPDKVKQQLAAERAAAAKKAKKAAGGKPGVNVAKPPSQAEIKAAVKKASDAQARLSIITNVLRGAGRERYDHFLANGFPVWKGTGYYYNRYRPGFGTVLVGLFIFGGGAAHYLALYMGWKRQREFVERYIKFARHAAWGENLGINVPGVDGSTASLPPAAAAPTPEEEEGRVMPTNRRMRRMQEKETKREAAKDAAANLGRRGRKNAPASASGSGTATPTPAPVAASGPGPQGAKKRVVAENGKILVVDSLGDVYLEQQDEEGKIQEFLLDADEIPPPTISDTAVVRLPLFLYRQTVGRALGQHKAAGSDDEYDSDAEEVAEVDDEEDSEPGKATPSTDSNEDFELLEKSTDSLGQARSSGVAGGRAKGKQRKAGKRK